MTAYVSRWGESGPRPEPNHSLDDLFSEITETVRLELTSSTEAVWDLVSAIERIGELSPECVEAWWVPGYEPRSVGGRFEGRNRVVDGDDVYEWIRPCDVVVFDPPREFVWTAGDCFDGTPATQWAFRIHPLANGCTVEQEFRHLPSGLSGLRLQAETTPHAAAQLVAERRSQLRSGMMQALERVRRTVDEPLS